MFVSSRPGPGDCPFLLRLILHAHNVPQRPYEWPSNCGGDAGAEGEERGAGKAWSMDLCVSLVPPKMCLACVFSQWGRKQEVEYRK